MKNTVDMKMGASYKVVQPRQYKTSEDDFAEQISMNQKLLKCMMMKKNV